VGVLSDGDDPRVVDEVRQRFEVVQRIPGIDAGERN
jgi:hypothetical protein